MTGADQAAFIQSEIDKLERQLVVAEKMLQRRIDTIETISSVSDNSIDPIVKLLAASLYCELECGKAAVESQCQEIKARLGQLRRALYLAPAILRG